MTWNCNTRPRQPAPTHPTTVGRWAKRKAALVQDGYGLTLPDPRRTPGSAAHGVRRQPVRRSCPIPRAAGRVIARSAAANGAATRSAPKSRGPAQIRLRAEHTVLCRQSLRRASSVRPRFWFVCPLPCGANIEGARPASESHRSARIRDQRARICVIRSFLLILSLDFSPEFLYINLEF